MSDHTAPRRPRDEQAIDDLLADSGYAELDGSDTIRTELLELRSLGSTAPLPSDAVRSLMVSSTSATTSTPTTLLAAVAPADTSASTDELAARRRRKRRGVIAGLAVAVSLAGGATAAAASEGGIPGAFEHLGAAIGTVVTQFTPGFGGSPRQEGPAGLTPTPTVHETAPALVPGQPQPAPVTTGGSGPAHSDPHPTPGGGGAGNAPGEPARDQPGEGVIPKPPTVPVTPPDIDPSKVDPSKLRPSDLPVPLPSQVIPKDPATPDIPAK